MKNDEIKQENKKALPKFMLFAIACAIVGGFAGYYSSYGFKKGWIDKLLVDLKNVCAFFGMNIAPWLMVAIAIFILVVCTIIYKNAKKVLNSWDGEDENASSLIERKLSIVILITSTTVILSFFLIAASFSNGFTIFDDINKTIVFFIGVISFFIIVIESFILQKKCVDITKHMNPEKKTSFYDMRFQKKWIENCDEAEKIIIGKCAYKAYCTTNVVCAILSILFVICAPIFNTGFLPSLTVCIIWIVNMLAYFKETMRYSKAGNKIS